MAERVQRKWRQRSEEVIGNSGGEVRDKGGKMKVDELEIGVREDRGSLVSNRGAREEVQRE